MHTMVIQVLSEFQLKMKMIDDNVPHFVQPAFRDFAGVKDSKIYSAFSDGSAVYISYILKKST